MTDIAKMTLKILYSLDNGTNGTYLARSKKPQDVRLATIPNPDTGMENDAGSFRIGAVDLSSVLQEIYLNSPELLNHHISKSGHDYNIYYRDICEADEPLVSLGLLSKIRQKMNEETTQETYRYDCNEEEEPFIVTGRVCSNFAALLKKSYSSTGSCELNKEASSLSDTLEVKMRFTRVMTTKTSRRPSTNMSNLPKAPVPMVVTNQINSKQTNNNTDNLPKMGKPLKIIHTTKRPMNPTPAQKAERTQSLPIWSLKQGMNNTGLPTNSIAHRIFLADRKTENSNAKSVQQVTTYQVSALQQDNTVQKFKVDDSVSKRFDFMLNKKKKQQNQPQQLRQVGQSKSNNTNKKSNAATRARRFNTMTVLPTPLTESCQGTKSDKKQKQRGSSISNSFNIPMNEQELVFQQLLTTSPLKKSNSAASFDGDKENQPPSNVPTDSIDLDILSFSDLGLKNELDWFGNYDPFGSPALLPDVNTDSGIKPSSTTPKDPNTCNTVDLEFAEEQEETTPRISDNENDDENDKVDALCDADRTSPIDTLSMPLMELNDKISTRMVTCQEQLRRLPLLGNQPKAVFTVQQDTPTTEARGVSEEDSNNDEDATSVVMHFSSSYQDTPPHIKKTNHQKKDSISECSSPVRKRQLEIDDQEEACEDDDDQKENLKKQRIMPSSPTVFTYPDDTSSNADANDLFSSFIHGPPSQHNDNDSTPVTQYQNQSSDNLKNL